MQNIFNDKSKKLQRQKLRKVMTSAEIIVWSKLKNKQLLGFKFRRQYGIDKYVVDFYCPTVRLAIELDGDSHFVKTKAERDDILRQTYIESQGIKFLRFTNTEIYKNLAGVLAEIENFLLSFPRLG